MVFKLCFATLNLYIPTRFYNWWHKYGANLKILPEPVLKLYGNWVETHSTIHNMNNNDLFERLYPMYFFCKIEIPWIWRWSVETAYDEMHLPYLKRWYHVKWWNGIRVKEKASQTEEIIQKNKELVDCSLTEEIQSENPRSKLKKMRLRKYS